MWPHPILSTPPHHHHHLVFKDLETAALPVNDWPLRGKVCTYTVDSYRCWPQSHWSSISEADINGEDSASFKETAQFLFACCGRDSRQAETLFQTYGSLIENRLFSLPPCDLKWHLWANRTENEMGIWSYELNNDNWNMCCLSIWFLHLLSCQNTIC